MTLESSFLGEGRDRLHVLPQGPGSGSGPAVCLVHGNLSTSRFFEHTAIDHPDRVASVTLIAPLSPFGFGGTRDTEGTLCHQDAAGSGAGAVNPEFVRRLAEGDRGDDSAASPRSVLRSLYLRPPLRLPAEVEDMYTDEILATDFVSAAACQEAGETASAGGS